LGLPETRGHRCWSEAEERVAIRIPLFPSWFGELASQSRDGCKNGSGLLRHANISTTLGLYAHQVNSSMLAAQDFYDAGVKTRIADRSIGYRRIEKRIQAMSYR